MASQLSLRRLPKATSTVSLSGVSKLGCLSIIRRSKKRMYFSNFSIKLASIQRKVKNLGIAGVTVHQEDCTLPATCTKFPRCTF